MKRFLHAKLLLLLFGASLVLLLQSISLTQTGRNSVDISYVHNQHSIRDGIKKSERHVNDANSNKIYNQETKSSVQMERIQKMKQQCDLLRNKYPGTLDDYAVKRHFMYDLKKKFVFCDLPKVGSTFLKQVLHIVLGHRNVRNPFQISGDEAHGIPFQTFDRLTFDKVFHILANSNKYLFVRDPYSRIVSAYVDKLFTTNFVFWDTTGKGIVRRYRKNPDELSLKCGHNVSFYEFLKHIVTSEVEGKNRNPHWYPMYEGCRPCGINYDFIGKIETFKDDVKQLLIHTNSSHLLDLTGMDSKNDGEAISLTVNRAFDAARTRNACLTLPQSLERAWKVLQVRGVISHKSEFPYETIKRNSSVTKTEFTHIIMTELRKFPMDRQSKRKIRQEVLYIAYKSIPKSDLEHFREIFLPDFLVFGYEKKFPGSPFSEEQGWHPFDLKL